VFRVVLPQEPNTGERWSIVGCCLGCAMSHHATIGRLMQKPLILLVEDHPDEALLVHEALATVDTNIELRIATSVAAAWTLLAEMADGGLPALVITDHHLLDGCGQELIARLQGCPTRGRIPVVMVSGDAMRPEDLGTIAWFTKPDTWAGWRTLAHELVRHLAPR